MLAQMFKYVYTSIIIVLSISVCIYIIIIFCKATKLLFCYIIFPFQCLSIALWWFLNLQVSLYSGIWKQLSVTGTGVSEAIYAKPIFDSVLISNHFIMTLLEFLMLFFTCTDLHLFKPSITKQWVLLSELRKFL